MKKLIKGFTLIELIIVMAILSILTLAMAQMFKPIRETYVDATLIESRRSAQTGVEKYITESIRYATDLGIYTEVSDISTAAWEFATAYLNENGVTAPSADDIKSVTKKVEVIVIDNTEDKYTYNGTPYRGRLLRRKFVPDGSDVKPLDSNDYEDITKSDYCRMALGSAYYGGSDYTISLDLTGGKGEIGVSVSSTATARTTGKVGGSRDISEGGSVVSTPGYVLCKNLSEVGGMYDISKYNASNSTAPGTKVYIVWLNDHKNIPYTYKTGSMGN